MPGNFDRKTTTDRDLTILSIDPGSKFLGWGVIHASGPADRFRILAHGYFQPSKRESITAAGFDLIYKGIRGILKDHPEISRCALEQFKMRKRRTSAHIVPQVQAIVRLAWYSVKGMDCELMAPLKWKKMVIGNAYASKEETASVLHLLGYLPKDLRHDEYDATGIGLAYLMEYYAIHSSTGVAIRKATQKVKKKVSVPGQGKPARSKKNLSVTQKSR